jgi:hypothetical protein
MSVATTIELCRTCEQPFCAQCDEDATVCADSGWHCGSCGWLDCRPCVTDDRGH